MTIGEQIRTLRKGAGFTTSASLAKAVGCSDSTIRRIELDQRNPSEKMLQGIANAIGGYLIIDGTRKIEPDGDS